MIHECIPTQPADVNKFADKTLDILNFTKAVFPGSLIDIYQVLFRHNVYMIKIELKILYKFIF